MTAPSAMTWRLVALVALVLAAFVALSLAHVDTTQFVTLLGLAITGGGITVHNATRLDKQDSALAKITKQTNGVLDARIRAGVHAELVAAGLITDPPPTTTATRAATRAAARKPKH